MSTFPIENIPTDCIRADQGINPRAGGCDPLTVEEYTVAWEAGATFPPLKVYRDADGTTWLSEGFHRLEAARLADGIDSVPCEVREGGKREALLNAVGSNATHGKRRSNEDKRRAVELLLADPEWAKKSDRWIAERCAVSTPLVGTVRKSTVNIYSSREGKDGKVRNLPTAAVPTAEPDDEPDDNCPEPDNDATEHDEPSAAELTRAVAARAARAAPCQAFDPGERGSFVMDWNRKEMDRWPKEHREVLSRLLAQCSKEALV